MVKQQPNIIDRTREIVTNNIFAVVPKNIVQAFLDSIFEAFSDIKSDLASRYSATLELFQQKVVDAKKEA